MKTVFERFVFPLARIGKRGQLQKYSVVVFEQESFFLKMPGSLEIPYSQIEGITFSADFKNRNGILETFWFFQERNGGKFNIQTAEDSYEFILEWDARFRAGELICLFSFFYNQNLQFQEFDLNQRPLFLLEPIPLNELGGKIEKLRKLQSEN